MKLQKLSAVFRHVKQIAMEGVCRTQLVCSPDHSPDDLINVLFSREISAVSFWDPIGPWPLLVNEISLDKFSCLVRVIRELDSGVWDVLFSSATLRKKSGIAMTTTFICLRPPPHSIFSMWINTYALYRPLLFLIGSPPSMCGLTSSEQSIEPFSIHVFTLNSVKTAKAEPTGDLSETGLVPFHPL